MYTYYVCSAELMYICDVYIKKNCGKPQTWRETTIGVDVDINSDEYGYISIFENYVWSNFNFGDTLAWI